MLITKYPNEQGVVEKVILTSENADDVQILTAIADNPHITEAPSEEIPQGANEQVAQEEASGTEQ